MQGVQTPQEKKNVQLAGKSDGPAITEFQKQIDWPNSRPDELLGSLRQPFTFCHLASSRRGFAGVIENCASDEYFFIMYVFAEFCSRL